MPQMRGQNKKKLYDKNVVEEYKLNLKERKEGTKISILSDAMFKTMFYQENRIKYSCKFFSYYLDISYEELLENLKLGKGELDKDKEKRRKIRLCSIYQKYSNEYRNKL